MNEITKPSRIDFDNLDLNQIQKIYTTGSLQDLTAAEQVYYSLMEKVRGLRARMRINGRLVTKAGIIRNLKEADGLTDYQARRVYADAVNFFYDNEEVRPKAWANLYAEKCENFGNMLFSMGKPKEALRYLKMAAELRGCFRDQENEIPKELLDQTPTVIYTTSAKDLGSPDTDRKRVEEFIDSIPEIPVIVKENVKEDARINGFNLKKRMLYDKSEFTDAEEVE
ncbi:hypothetical protein [Prevotella sp. E13-27]|uniref:hypothetical protein n=1 Tax=Prevotella sp. E13-27 TaxID=2938122 RepID=UPI00200ACBBD|nr:hypothetical protein [Prevotella sp. E13-27]MCK8622621.1 hypothetical protein [Prevotella sp. E13-27]